MTIVAQAYDCCPYQVTKCMPATIRGPVGRLTDVNKEQPGKRNKNIAYDLSSDIRRAWDLLQPDGDAADTASSKQLPHAALGSSYSILALRLWGENSLRLSINPSRMWSLHLVHGVLGCLCRAAARHTTVGYTQCWPDAISGFTAYSHSTSMADDVHIIIIIYNNIIL